MEMKELIKKCAHTHEETLKVISQDVEPDGGIAELKRHLTWDPEPEDI